MKRVRRLKQVFVVGVALGFALQSIIINPRAPKRGGYMTVVQPLTFFYKTKLGSLFVFAAPSLPGSRRPPSLLSPTHAMLASALATGLPSSGATRPAALQQGHASPQELRYQPAQCTPLPVDPRTASVDPRTCDS